MNVTPSPSRQVAIVEKEFKKIDLDEEVCKPTDVEYEPDDQDLDVDAQLDRV